MWIQDAVEWTLLRGGALNRKELVSQIYAFPFLHTTPIGREEVEARVGFVTRNDNQKFRYCADTDSWSIASYASTQIFGELEQIPERGPEVHGCGVESVYVVHSPIERFEAVCNSSQQKYKVKIGKTKRDTNSRLRELQTGNPNELRVGLEFRTNKATELENFLHRELKVARTTETNKSKVWFYSNFEQLVGLYEKFKSEEWN